MRHICVLSTVCCGCCFQEGGPDGGEESRRFDAAVAHHTSVEGSDVRASRSKCVAQGCVVGGWRGGRACSAFPSPKRPGCLLSMDSKPNQLLCFCFWRGTKCPYRAVDYGLTDLHVDPAAGPRDDTVHSMHSVGSIGECVPLVGAHAGRTYVELICVLCAPRCAIVCRYCVDAVHRIGLQRPGVPGPCACQSICAATTGYIWQAQRWPGSCVSAPCSRELPFAVARVHNVTDAGTSTQIHPLIMVSSDLE
jgi:hypothetical protein